MTSRRHQFQFFENHCTQIVNFLKQVLWNTQVSYRRQKVWATLYKHLVNFGENCFYGEPLHFIVSIGFFAK